MPDIEDYTVTLDQLLNHQHSLLNQRPMFDVSTILDEIGSLPAEMIEEGVIGGIDKTTGIEIKTDKTAGSQKTILQSRNYVANTTGFSLDSGGTVDIAGGTITAGTFQTATSGQRITITGTDNYIRIYDSSAQIGALGGSTDATSRVFDLVPSTDIEVARILSQHTTTTNHAFNVTAKGYGIVGYFRGESTSASRALPIIYISNLGYGGLINAVGSSNDTYAQCKIQNAGSGNTYEGYDVTNSVTAFSVAKDGTITIGDLTAAGQKYLHIKGDDDGDDDPGSLVLYDHDGTPYYLWVDRTGDLRIHTSAPADEDADGVVVGSQS